jgi:hypothetical protein
MSYTINKTDGTKLIVLRDGTVDITTTDLALFGKGYAGFGERLNENFVKILENFANTTAPAKKIKGQLWYDTLKNQIKVWNGSAFKNVGSSSVDSTRPSGANAGDMWFDSGNGQLYVYSGVAWQLIGPTTVSGSGVTQVVPDSIRDSVGVSKSILKLTVDDQIVAVVARENFTPLVSLAGFPTISKGITLNSTSIVGAKFTGTATNTELFDGNAVNNFLRTNSEQTTNFQLTIASDSGLLVGAGLDGLIGVVDGHDLVMQNNTNGGDIIFKINKSGAAETTAMTISGATGHVSIPNLTVAGRLTITGTQVVVETQTLSIEDNIIELNRNISSANAMPNYSGLKIRRSDAGGSGNAHQENLFWVWDETFANDGTTGVGDEAGAAGGAWTAFRDQGDIASPVLVDIRANIVHATSTSARYADLAERYAADMLLEVGDVVMLGGSKEITKCTEELDHRVFGVVSDKPAFLMNEDAGNNASHPMIALKGRARVKVIGEGKAGDRIVSSNIAGAARVAELDECTAFNVVGRLISDKYNAALELTECAVGVK